MLFLDLLQQFPQLLSILEKLQITWNFHHNWYREYTFNISQKPALCLMEIIISIIYSLRKWI